MSVRPFRAGLGALFLLFLSGCATVPEPPAVALTGDPVRDAALQLESAPARDRVLWQYRLGLAAFRAGDTALAKRTFDDALGLAGGIIAADAAARRARTLFGAEAAKTFIGEPYERVLAFYYRAILYWRDGEVDNARACLRTAQIIDTDPENEQLASDYVLLDYLDGLASAQLGSDGSDALRRARGHARGWVPPDPDPGANVLVFAEYGRGPIKYAAGEYGELLRFRDGVSRLHSARLTVAGTSVLLRPWDDLHFQATTRGGRVMDGILRGKAVFKSGADTLGTAALVGAAGVAAGGDDDMSEGRRNLATGLALAGILAKVVSAATATEADTRQWEGLPQFLSFAALRLPPGRHEATVEFLNRAGQPVPQHTTHFPIEVVAGAPTAVVYVSKIL